MATHLANQRRCLENPSRVSAQRAIPVVPPRLNILGRLKETVLGLLFDEADRERPIGISQLSRKTFQPGAPAEAKVFFNAPQQFQGFRFIELSGE